MRAPWAIVCDFDGTALTEDLGNLVAYRFAGDGELPRRRGRATAAARIPFSVLLAKVFAPITAIARRDRGVRARARGARGPGSRRFVEACRAARPAVPRRLRRPRRVHRAGARAAPARAARPRGGPREPRRAARRRGSRSRFHGEDCGFCGFCKGDVVRELQAAGQQGRRCAATAPATATPPTPPTTCSPAPARPRALLRRARDPPRRVRDLPRGDGAVSGLR